MANRPNRRTTLKSIASASILGLAGCLSDDDQNDRTEPESDDHEGEPEGDHGEHDHGEEEEQDDHEDHGDHGDHGEHDHNIPDHPEPEATVRMFSDDTGDHFDPHVVWVEEGGTVTWNNESGAHSATAYHPDNDRPLRQPDGTSAWDSGVKTESGETFKHTFETPGVYQYYCSPHEDGGMMGAVIVGDPDPHEQPGLAEPQDSFSETAAEKITDLNEWCNEALGHTH